MTAVRSDSLESYREWLRRRGAGASTVSAYAYHAGRAAAGEDPFDRITDRGLSPKYRRVCKAAILSFARFNLSRGDAAAGELVEQIKEVKLPAPVSQTVKVPLDVEQWRALRVEIDEADYITEPMRAELGIMANRGLRRGDILRLHRKEVTDGLRTGTLSYVAKGERRLEFGIGKGWRGYLEILEDEFARNAGRGARGTKTVADLISPEATDEGRHVIAGAAVVRALRRVAKHVDGIDAEKFAPHDLRRTYATLFFEACGRDPVKLQSHFQWATISVAMNYVSAGSRESLDEIADQMLK